ncbi:MAG: hypothetical protein KBT34_02620, partial [Prevotella sp.]|nr:hypothetical protein [Candidatus Prevotella equi]
EYRTAQSLSVEEFPHMSLMTGSVTNVPAAGTAGYTLASKTSYGLGFYKYVGKTYNANYAWLDAAYVAEAQKAMADGSLDAAAKAGYMQMVFDDDIEDDYATDINGVYDREGSEGILDMILDPDAVIYDLHGRKVRADLLRQGEVYIFKGIKFKR